MSASETSGTASAPVDGPIGGWSPMRVLLIEDDPGDALLVEELIADAGVPIELTWVRSLAEATVALRSLTPACVLLDLHLPDVNGLDALQQTLAVAGGAAVVVLTGLAEESAGSAAVAAGAQDYLLKGRVEAELLGRALRYAVQRKQVEQAAAALQASQLRAAENARLERGLLPSPLLRAADITVTARYRPGRKQALLGGDFYDVVETGEGTVHVIIGDVSGHGPDEAALGVALRIAWRTLVLSGVPADRRLAMLEQVLVAERGGPEVFATVSTAEISADRRTVRMRRAGHPGVLARRGDGSMALIETSGGPALGVLPGVCAWPEEALPLETGGALMLFTDGLIEARTGRGHERLGEDGLLGLARTHAALPAARFVDTVVATAEELSDPTGGLADDVAIVHIEWSATS